MSIQKIKQAIYELEGKKTKLIYDALDALYQTIEQAEKAEPVAWRFWQPSKVMWCYINHVTDLSANREFQPLYTYPPSRKPLTDEEIYLATNMIDRGEQGWSIKFARAIERAHGIGEE